MPVELLSESERAKLSQFPAEISREDLRCHFTLSEEDREAASQLYGDTNPLGFALALSALRYLGFFPSDLTDAPGEAVRFVADQIGTRPEDLDEYGTRAQTVRKHQRRAIEHLGFERLEGEKERDRIGAWLVERALEHDRPSVLIETLSQKLKRERFVRPGITVIERMVAAARKGAHEESLHRLAPLLTTERKALLDELLVPDSPGERTPLGWLRRHATANSPRALLEVLEKLRQLQSWQVPTWDLSVLNPNRRKMLARLGRKYTNQALQRMGPERGYPILLAFLKRTFTDAPRARQPTYSASAWRGRTSARSATCASTTRPSPAPRRRRCASSTASAGSFWTTPSKTMSCGGKSSAESLRWSCRRRWTRRRRSCARRECNTSISSTTASPTCASSRRSSWR